MIIKILIYKVLGPSGDTHRAIPHGRGFGGGQPRSPPSRRVGGLHNSCIRERGWVQVLSVAILALAQGQNYLVNPIPQGGIPGLELLEGELGLMT